MGSTGAWRHRSCLGGGPPPRAGLSRAARQPSPVPGKPSLRRLAPTRIGSVGVGRANHGGSAVWMGADVRFQRVWGPCPRPGASQEDSASLVARESGPVDQARVALVVWLGGRRGGGDAGRPRHCQGRGSAPRHATALAEEKILRLPTSGVTTSPANLCVNSSSKYVLICSSLFSPLRGGWRSWAAPSRPLRRPHRQPATGDGTRRKASHW